MIVRAARAGRRASRALARCALPAALAACVTTYEDVPIDVAARAATPVAVAQTIPFPVSEHDARDRALLQFYSGVLDRMQGAARDRDGAGLEGLLEAYDRSDVPAWLRGVLDGYRALAKGMRFERHAKSAGAVELVLDEHGAEPPLGASTRFVLRIPAAPQPFRLGGSAEADPTGFLVALSVEDTFVDGSTSSSRTQDFVWLPAPSDLGGNADLEVPIGVDLPAAAAVKRVVNVRVDLMPGYVQVDGVRAPVQRTAVGATVVTQWPAGHREIEKAPLAALKAALQIGDAAHYPHIYVAAEFLRGAERDEAVPLLIDVVRFGREDQARLATVALRIVTDTKLPIGDRQSWLAWWQSQPR